jgi:hypothetical protein
MNNIFTVMVALVGVFIGISILGGLCLLAEKIMERWVRK